MAVKPGPQTQPSAHIVRPPPRLSFDLSKDFDFAKLNLSPPHPVLPAARGFFVNQRSGGCSPNTIVVAHRAIA